MRPGFVARSSCDPGGARAVRRAPWWMAVAAGGLLVALAVLLVYPPLSVAAGGAPASQLWSPAGIRGLTPVGDDVTPPVTTATGFDDNWHNTDVTISFTATDPVGAPGEAVSGVVKTEYAVDSGGWTVGTSVTIQAVPANDGTHNVAYFSTDASLNAEAAKSGSVKIDATKPAGTFVLAEGAATTGSHDVSANSNVADTGSGLDPNGMRFSTNGGSSWSDWRSYDASVTVTLPAGDGTKTVNAQYRDVAGNVLDKSDSIVVETGGPTGTFALANGAIGTQTTAVSGNSAVTDAGSGVTDMRFSTDGGASWNPDWIAYAASLDLTLPPGEGTKTVTAEYRDGVGNVLQLTDTIILDTTAPTTTRTDGLDLALYYNTPVTLTFQGADAGSGMVGDYAKTESRVDTGTWTTGTSVVVPAAAGDDAAHTVAFRSTDAAGNAEATQTVTVNIDVVAPAGRLSMANGASSTNSLTISAASAITDAHGPLQMRFSTDDKATWTDWAAYAAATTHTFGGGEGTKTLYAQYKDAAGNVAELSDTILYNGPVGPDTTPPVTTPSGADDRWHSGPVTVTFAAADNQGGSGMSGGSAKTEYQVDGGVWTVGTSVVIPAPVDHSNDGLHTVGFRSTDSAGNTETARTVTVRIDTIAPVGGFVLNGGAASTNTVVAQYDANVADANSPLEQRFSSDGKQTWTQWAPYAASGAVTLTAGAGTKTVIGQFRDPAGNVLEYADTIDLLVDGGDVSAPTMTMTGVKDKGWYRSSLLIQMSAVDNLAMAYIQYDLDGLPQIYPYNPATPKQARAVLTIVREPNAAHVLTYSASDMAGNRSPVRTVRFTVDTHGPITSALAASGKVRRTIQLKYRLADNLSPKATVTIVIKNSRGQTVKTLRPGSKAIGATWYKASWKPTARGTFRYYVKAKDVAGNAQSRQGNGKITVR